MKRIIGLALGIIVGIFAMLSFLGSSTHTERFGRLFRIQKLHMQKLSREIDPSVRHGLNHEGLNIQPSTSPDPDHAFNLRLVQTKK